MAEIVELFELNIDVESATKETRELKIQLEQLKTEAKKVKESQGALSQEYLEYEAAIKLTNKEVRKSEKLTQDIIKATDEEGRSLNSVRTENAALRAERNKINISTKEGALEVQKLNEQINKNTEFLKDNEDKFVQDKIAVGSYKESIQEALAESEQFGGVLPGITGSLGKVGTAFKVLAKNPLVAALTLLVGGLTAVFAAFKKTQKGADAFAKITATLSAVFDVFTGTIAKVGEFLFDLFENPKESLNNFAALVKENIITRFEGLLTLIPKLGKAIGLLFEGEFSEAAKVAGDAVAQVVLGVEDFTDKTGDAFTELSDNITTAVNSTLKFQNAQKSLENTIIKNTTSLAKLNKEAELQQQIADNSTVSLEERAIAAEKAREASEAAAEIETEQAKLQLQLINLTVRQKEASGLVTRELRQEQADATAAFIDAQKNETLTVQNNAKLREEIARDLFEKNLDFLIDNFDSIKTLNEKAIADDNKTLTVREGILNATKKLADDSFNEQIKQLQTRTDATINANDLINESDSKRLIEKVRLLKLDEIEETRLLEVIRERRTVVQDLADAEIEIETVKQDAIKEIKENANIAELESVQNNLFAKLDIERQNLEAKRIQEVAFAESVGAETTAINKKYAKAQEAISKAEFSAKLSLASEFAGNIAQIAGEGTAVGKAAAVASTTIQTIQGAQGAFAALSPIPIVGPALGIAAAGAAVVAGLANVKKILAVKSGLPGESGTGGGSGGGGVATPSIQTTAPTVNQGIVSRDTAAIGTADNIQLQPTLVIDEVTSQQNNESANNTTATI